MADTKDTFEAAGNIIGGSPTDRVIGMLLERTEAVRELHMSMREEFKGLIATNAEVKVTLRNILDRLETHEKEDQTTFDAINRSFESLGVKIDALGAQMLSTTTAGRIQRAQFDAGWKVIVILGGMIAAGFAIFAIFYNHR